MSEYYLMNKDKKLLLFKVEVDSIGVHRVKEVERYVDENMLPPRFSDIDAWLDRRNYAKHKGHLEKWLKEWGLDNPVGFIELTHALSLNDSLWVKPVDSDLEWDKINLYKNEFTDVVSKTAFEKGLHGLKLSSTSPEFTSEGSFEKCWIQEPDGVFLYKKGASGAANYGLEMYSEYYSSQYASVICDDYVSYDLVDFKGSIVSRCKMFTSEDEGFVPIYKYLNSDKNYYYDEILEFISPLGFEDDFRRMIVLDSVIFNTDRHFGNFGFIVDNDTFEIKRFAPVFDHNMAFMSRAMMSDLKPGSKYIEDMTHVIGGKMLPVGKALANDDCRARLRELLDQPILLHQTYNLPKERTDFLDKAVQEQIKGILDR